jgi:hypothetical protein
MRDASPRAIQQDRPVNPLESITPLRGIAPVDRPGLLKHKVRCAARLANDHVTFIPCCLKVAARSTAG